MPKQLLIVRHAHADLGGLSVDDFDRPLNTKGVQAARVMAEKLQAKQVIPQFMVSSPALRAITTANIFAETLGISKNDIIENAAVYEAEVQALLRVVNQFENRFDFAALFGHNPGLTQLVLDFCNTGGYNIPPCGVILIEFPFDDWQLVSAGTGEMKFYDFSENAAGL